MKNKNLIESFNNAVNGIIYAIRNERNMKIHLAVAIFVVFLTMFFNVDRFEMLVLLVTIALVFVCELFNSAAEAIVDIITDKYHPAAKTAKDIAAGAVLVSAIMSVFVGYLVFYDKISPYSEKVIIKIAKSDAHITFIIILSMLIVILTAKALTKKGTPFSGGMISGHAALAFSMVTSITFITKNFLVMLISFFMALMVAQSRVEGKIHSFYEVLLGGVLGILVTTLILQFFMS